METSPTVQVASGETPVVADAAGVLKLAAEVCVALSGDAPNKELSTVRFGLAPLKTFGKL